MMNTLTYLFLALLAINTLVQWWLLHRHLRHVRDHRDAVPSAFSDRISLAEHRKAADYVAAKGSSARIDLIIGVVLLLAWTLGGGIDLLDGLWRTLAWSPVLTGTGFLVSVVLIMGLLEMPMTLWHTFVIEQRFGFNNTTVKLFIQDTIKQTLLGLLIGAPLIATILWLMQTAGDLWWLYAWGVWTTFSLVMMWAYPAFIAPLFNEFKPLENEELETSIKNLLGRNGLNAQGVFVMDGSRRSGHGNAYFTGFGSNKRIVFFDTLLKELDNAEIEAVLAHEVGHFKLKHIPQRLILMVLMSLAGLWILGQLTQQPGFYSGLGVSHASNHAALLLFMLVMPVFTFFIDPLMSRLSRRHEFQADAFAATQSDASTLVRALVKLYKENASTLTPDPLYSAFHDSHPPAILRIAHLNQQHGVTG